MDTNNRRSDKLKLRLAEKKAKIQDKTGDAVKKLFAICRKLKCHPPIYFLENGKICISLDGSYVFSQAPDFKSRDEITDKEKARLDVTRQALRWIEHNKPPSYYWKDAEAEDTLVDLFSGLALRVYENDTSQEEVQKFMLHLEGRFMAQLREGIESKKGSALDPAKFKRALDICRFLRLGDGTVIAEHANDEVSMAFSEADVVYTDQSQQTEADLSSQLCLNNATTSVPPTAAETSNDGTNESVYGEQVAADANDPVSESDAPTPGNIDEPASDPDPSTRGFILRNSVVENLLPGMSMQKVIEWMSGSFINYCDYHDDHARMHIVSTILSKEGDSFMAKVNELGANISVKNVALMELIMQPYSPAMVQRLWGSQGYQAFGGPGAYDLEQFLNMCDGGLLHICDEISKEFQGGAKGFLDLFLNWHRNGMLSRVLDLSIDVGDRTQGFIDRLLKLESTGLLPLIDAVIAETDGKPVPLLESFLRWNKNDVAQRLLDFDVRGEMSATSLVEAALDFGKWNIVGDVRSLLIDAEFKGKPNVFFHQLRKWQGNKSFQCLHILDQATSDRSPEFLDLALRMCKTGLMRLVTENKELIGDRPCGFFNDMFEVSRLIVNGQAIVVARDVHGNFTRDLTPNLRPRLLSTSLSYKLQSLPAWMDSICGTGDSTSPSQLEFENVGSNELSKFVNFSLKLYGWGVHSWASNNLDFIGTDPALFFNQLFHVAAVLKNGPTSPVVLEAIEATQKIMGGTPVSVGTGKIDASPSASQMSAVASLLSNMVSQSLQPPSSASSKQMSAVASSLSNMVSQSLKPPPKPAFSFDWQSNLPASKLAAPPKPASTSKWPSSNAGSNLSAPFSNFSSSKGKKTETTLPDPADSTGPKILAYGKCIKCPRPRIKIHHDGKMLCIECRTD